MLHSASATDCPLWSDIAGQSGRVRSAACAGEERGHDVGGVPVERDSGPVVAHGGAGVAVTGGFLDVAELGSLGWTSVFHGGWRRDACLRESLQGMASGFFTT